MPNELRCIYCGGNLFEPDHDAHCDGKQGGRDEPLPPVWMPPFDPTSPAFIGLTVEVINQIRGAVAKDHVLGLIACLDDIPRHADDVRQCMLGYSWFPAKAKRDSQLRRIRIYRDAAVVWEYPVCSTNAGYFLGTWNQVYESATRARVFATGAFKRATVMEYLADKMRRAS